MGHGKRRGAKQAGLQVEVGEVEVGAGRRLGLEGDVGPGRLVVEVGVAVVDERDVPASGGLAATPGAARGWAELVRGSSQRRRGRHRGPSADTRGDAAAGDAGRPAGA